MFATNYKIRQLRIQYDTDKLSELGKEMAMKGQFGLKIEKERLSISSLDFLHDFRHLEEISIYGVSKKISILADLPNLRSVALCSLSTKDVGFLSSLNKLEEIWIQGIRLKDWNSLRQLKQIKAITLFNLRQENLSFLEDMKNLQIIKINRCSKVKAIPSLKNLHQLRRVILETVNSIEDISGISQAPNLKDIIVMGADSLSPEEFDCFKSNKSIRKVLPGIGLMNSKRYKNVISRLPSELLMNGFYGTQNEGFTII